MGIPWAAPRRRGASSRAGRVSDGRTGLEVGGPAGTHSATQHRCRALGALGARCRRAAGEWRRCALPGAADAEVGAGGDAAVPAGQRVGGPERWQHGHGTQGRPCFHRDAASPITGEDRALGVVDFAIFPHLDHPGSDENTMAVPKPGPWRSATLEPTVAEGCSWPPAVPHRCCRRLTSPSPTSPAAHRWPNAGSSRRPSSPTGGPGGGWG